MHFENLLIITHVCWFPGYPAGICTVASPGYSMSAVGMVVWPGRSPLRGRWSGGWAITCGPPPRPEHKSVKPWSLYPPLPPPFLILFLLALTHSLSLAYLLSLSVSIFDIIDYNYPSLRGVGSYPHLCVCVCVGGGGKSVSIIFVGGFSLTLNLG